MKTSRYELSASESLTTFEFISEGAKGKIHKLIQFTATNYKDVYNLSFGDKNSEAGQFDDAVISNNGDSEKVLATVVAAVYAFTDRHPDAWIYATGSTKSRTRLYRMGITKFLEEVERDYEVYGQLNDEWEIFRKNVDYEAFLAKRRIS